MKKQAYFSIEIHSPHDKSFTIYGPSDFRMAVDFDDVDHQTVERQANKGVNILNKHWKSKPNERIQQTAEVVSAENI